MILCVSGVTAYEYPPTAPLHCKHLIWFILKAVNQCAYPPTKWIPTIQKHVRTLKHKDNCFLMISHYANTHHVAINLGGSFYLPDHQLIRHTDVYYMRKVMRQRLLCTTLSIFFNEINSQERNPEKCLFFFHCYSSKMGKMWHSHAFKTILALHLGKYLNMRKTGGWKTRAVHYAQWGKKSSGTG